MATITEDFVSFELAKLLKEKGFDARCPMIYTAEGELLYTDVKHHNMYAVTNKLLEYYTDIIAPTHQMAMKWLREVHNINLNIIFIKRFDKGYWNKGNWTFNNIEYKSYEQACEAAIKYSLENLI